MRKFILKTILLEHGIIEFTEPMLTMSWGVSLKFTNIFKCRNNKNLGNGFHKLTFLTKTKFTKYFQMQIVREPNNGLQKLTFLTKAMLTATNNNGIHKE